MKEAVIQIGNYIAFAPEALAIRDKIVAEAAAKEATRICHEEQWKKEYLTTTQAGEILGRGKDRIVEYIQEGIKIDGKTIKLKAHRKNGTGNYRISRFELMEFKKKGGQRFM